jgi:hypothetical protein
MWKKIRVLILLVILLIVAINAYRDKNQDWTKPIYVQLHPINADGLSSTQAYIQKLSIQDLDASRAYLQAFAANYRAQDTVFYFKLGRELKTLPPKVPEPANIWNTIWWSLKFRFYAWQQHESVDGYAAVTLFLNYYDPEKTKSLKHSTALENGRIGSVHLFAAEKQSEQNKIVLVHELLHAFGATDKYDLATGQPIYPIGYAFPYQHPLFPQAKAELMAGHIPMSQTKSKMPESINDTLIGDITAEEIGWKR